ncbi:MAG TPA: hypothetical protein VMW27_02885 [Thermoanaerobaculia bacterium]|nr:hypothetical protein [Thermoanaerobaculia bacterium]
MEIEAQRIETPLGLIEFSLAMEDDRKEQKLSSAEIRIAAVAPQLPTGMSVAGCYGAIASLTPAVELHDVQFQAKLHATVPVDSGPETGEGLDAKGFRSSKYVLIVGTEDRDYLAARLAPGVEVPEFSHTYTPDSLSVRIAVAPAGTPITLHFIAAWNELPEPQDCSCWYAVDQPHQWLLSALGAE